MIKLLKKEFVLCLHPTAILFLFLAFLVFVPNYPYEVIFFFSGLSVFFISLTARENGDPAFTCCLPVKKSFVPLARILMVVIMQCALFLMTAIAITVKEVVFPAEMQVNLAGNAANVAMLGFGAVVLGIFNLVFFPIHFQNPKKVGIPFVIATVAVYLLISLFIVFRWTLPFFTEIINTTDPANLGAKVVVLIIGLCLYATSTSLAVWLSMKRFEKVDL